MKGYAMLGLNKTGWIEKPKPECGPLDAILRPVVLAPCTSDVHTVWEGGIGDLHDRILGHEAVGEVVETGSLVKDFRKGDICIVPAITPDWNALESQAGYHVHAGGMLAGYKFTNIKDGVFAEFFHVNDADGNLALLPKGLDPAVACMLSDMVPTGLHGSELAEVEYGDTVLVIGIGPVGLMAVRGAVLKGAGRLLAVGSRPDCVRVAKDYGATDIINYRNGPILKQVMELTGSKGVDRIIIAGG
ncbi:MAG: alcohol dehydrogenase catalytic domain-containing protein, partial [Treponema sp.]|nr:alcohol dehydrogenase catalytic domain-containing protein [Treponema sp.]